MKSFTRWIKRRFTYANVVATLALVLALGGTAYAAATIGSAQVIDRSLLARDIKGGTLGSFEVRDASLRVADLTPGARDTLKGQAGERGVAGLNGLDGAPGAVGATGPSAGFWTEGGASATSECEDMQLASRSFVLARPSRLLVDAYVVASSSLTVNPYFEAKAEVSSGVTNDAVGVVDQAANTPTDPGNPRSTQVSGFVRAPSLGGDGITFPAGAWTIRVFARLMDQNGVCGTPVTGGGLTRLSVTVVGASEI